MAARGSGIVGSACALIAVLQEVPEAVVAVRYHDPSAKLIGPTRAQEGLLGVDVGAAN